MGQVITGTINGGLDRYITSKEKGVKGWNLLLNTFVGSFEGMVAGLSVQPISKLGDGYSGLKTAISSAVTSVPGLGLRIAKSYLMLYGAVTASNITDNFIMENSSAISRILALGGIVTGEVFTWNFSIKKFLKKINYPDPIWGR